VKYEDRPYQAKCLDAIDRAEKEGVTRQLIVMATGLGKSVIFSGLLRRRGLPNTFGLLHREELIAQMATRILELNPGARIGVEKAERFSDPSSDRVILASVQSVGRKDRARIGKIAREWPKVLLVDEAHHSPSSSFIEVLDHFGVYGKEPRRDALLIGLTATPDRLDEMGYDKIFDDVTFRYGLREAIRDGWLADIRAWRIDTDLDLSKVKSRAGDFAQGELAEAVEMSNMDEAAVRTWAARCRGRRSLFYCVDKVHAAKLHRRLSDAGAKAAVVVDDTPSAERRASVGLFQAGEVEALVNVLVFSEGFDAPETECVHVLRPTKSRALYTQVIGRGTRKTERKQSVDVFDYTDQAHDICSVGQIFGLPDSWDLKGQSVAKDADKLEEVEAELGLKVDGAKSVADMVKRVKERRIDLIKGALADSGLPSKLAWLRPLQSAERWVVSWRNETEDKIASLPDSVRERAKAAISKMNLWGSYERIELFRNELGRYEAKMLRTPSDGRQVEAKLDSDKSLSKLVSRVEKLIADRRPHKVNLLRKDARWGSDPSSDKQREVLRRKGVPEALLPEITKREASSLINLPAATIKSWFSEVSA
jgi:superfamily II DNA or RNA helicase